MKIGVLTMPLYNNYGGNLQAYALMTYLKKLGHEPILINVQLRKKAKAQLPIIIIKRLILKYLLFRKDINWIVPEWVYKKKIDFIEQKIHHFIQNHINPKTHPIYNEKEFKKYTKLNCDAYIVGSDQVWRPSMFQYIEHAFFDFVDVENIPLLSYAASFGVDTWEFSLEETEKYKYQLKKFKAVSVREDSGISLCLKYFQRDSIRVLDPTLLLAKEDYINLATSENEISTSRDLLYYILDCDEDKNELIKKTSERFNYIPFSINVKTTERTASINDRIYPSVTSWLQGFIDTKYVITDSFHGCVFSIIFNKPFIVYANKYRGMARFNSLLSIFGLESRLITSLKDFNDEIFSSSIDWKRINTILEKEKSISHNYLITALKS
jgi:hypothetical protein